MRKFGNFQKGFISFGALFARMITMLELLRSKQTFKMVTGILFSLVTLPKNDQYFKKSVNLANLAKNMEKVIFFKRLSTELVIFVRNQLSKPK